MENEIMNYEEIEAVDGEIEAGESTGMSTGVAMLIGAGLTCAVGAAVKLVKKGIAAYKAKKEQPAANDHDFCVLSSDSTDGETK